MSYIKIKNKYTLFFFFNDTATTEIYTLSLHDALPISVKWILSTPGWRTSASPASGPPGTMFTVPGGNSASRRSEEHTSELQSRSDLVCRLLLEKKKKRIKINKSILQHPQQCHVDIVLF